MPSVGAVLAVTLIVTLAVELKPAPSVTCKVSVFAPNVAPQVAAILPEIVPLVLVKPVSVKPVGTLRAVTVRLPAGVKSSETVAKLEIVPALPC